MEASRIVVVVVIEELTAMAIGGEVMVPVPLGADAVLDLHIMDRLNSLQRHTKRQ